MKMVKKQSNENPRHACCFCGRALLLIAAITIAAPPRFAVAANTNYIVQPGDYLVLIGQKFGIPWQSIAEANITAAPYVIFPGESLSIPQAKCERGDLKGTQYVVNSGDNLVSIGGKFGVSWQKIAEANCIGAPYTIYPGQVLVIPPPQKCADSDSGGTQYTVQAGDFLFAIGQHFGVPWQEIADANCIEAPFIIFPGQVLVIPQEQAEDSD